MDNFSNGYLPVSHGSIVVEAAGLDLHGSDVLAAFVALR